MYSAYLSSDHLGVKSKKVKTYIFEVFVLLSIFLKFCFFLLPLEHFGGKYYSFYFIYLINSVTNPIFLSWLKLFHYYMLHVVQCV